MRCRNASSRRVRAVVPAAVLLLAGCSAPVVPDGAPGGAAVDAAEVIRQVPERLMAAGSSHAVTWMEMAAGGTRVAILGEGVFDYRRGVGELRVTLPPDPARLTGGPDGAAAEAPPVTEVFTVGALYMKNRGAGVPSDKWVRVELAALPDGNLVTGGATDPITAAALLRGVQRADDLGAVEVDGEMLRRYQGVTDIAAAAEAAPEPDRREQLTAALGGFTETAVPFDAYLDEEGRLRKVRHRFSFANASPQGPRAVEVTSTTALDAFGIHVSVRLPEPDEIYGGAVAVTGTTSADGRP